MKYLRKKIETLFQRPTIYEFFKTKKKLFFSLQRNKKFPISSIKLENKNREMKNKC